jgi:hypothetical protein
MRSVSACQLPSGNLLAFGVIPGACRESYILKAYAGGR